MSYWIEDDGYIDHNVYIDIVSEGAPFWVRLCEAFKHVFFNGKLVLADVVWTKDTSEQFVEALKKVPHK